MQYELLKDLPFLKANSILSYGCWVGGGLGRDRGETKYECGLSSYNGVETFSKIENTFLESMLDNKVWILKIPNSLDEALNLYNTKYLSKEEFKNYIILKESQGKNRRAG